jgi:Domain of unknown function (DUF4328)
MQAYKSIQGLGWVVIVLLALMIPMQPMWLAVAAVAPDFYTTSIMPIASQIDAAATILRLLTMIVFGYWIYVAGRNLVDAGWEGLEFTPGARIWWFAVPFANFVMPYFGMRELWNASRGAEDVKQNAALLICWWSCWIGFALLSNFARFGNSADGPNYVVVVATLVLLPLHILAIMVVRGIMIAQARPAPNELGDVFA